MNKEMVADIEKNIRFLAEIIKQKGRKILSSYTITPPQFIALQWLLEKGDMTIGELSNKMDLAFSSTTNLIDRMEKNHLVKRIRDEKDRRIVRIHLLKEGIRIIEEVIEKRQLYLNEVLQNFNDKEINTLQSSLEKLYENMKG